VSIVKKEGAGHAYDVANGHLPTELGPSGWTKVGTHFGGHTTAFILISAAGSRIHQDDMNIIVCGTAYLAVHFLTAATIGKMRVLYPGHQANNAAFNNWVVIQDAANPRPIRQVCDNQIRGLPLQIPQVSDRDNGDFRSVGTKVVLGVALSCLGRDLIRRCACGDNSAIAALG